MTCVELQQSLAETEGGGNAAQLAHLKSCTACSSLVAELNLITSSAAFLRESAEPSPRVWNSLEIALRQEGLIHGPRPNRSLIPSLGSNWRWARWLAPAAAALLIAVGVYVRQHSLDAELARDAAKAAAPAASGDVQVAALNDAALNDDDLLQEIAQQAPAIRAQYEDNLRHVNEYIQDAKSNVADNPTDEDARRSLMEAYQEKAMLFELAMDRSLP
jgi:hypothetical protein